MPDQAKTYAALLVASALLVVIITFFLQMSAEAQLLYHKMTDNNPYFNFILTPFAYVLIVYLSRFWCTNVSGSGIPQLIAATDSHNPLFLKTLLSFRVGAEKILFITLAMLSGAPIGIEGPSIHVGGSFFYGINHFIQIKRKILIHALIAIGGSAGVIIVFNAPIAAFFFIYEEIGRSLKKQALLLIAIMCIIVYLLSTLYRGNAPYLINLPDFNFNLLLIWQLIPLGILGGILGGALAKTILYLSLKFNIQNKLKALSIALILGLVVALFNFISDGQVAGSGRHEVWLLLSSKDLGMDFMAMKLASTITSLMSGIPGGSFMPSLSVGASIGSELSALYTQIDAKIIIVMMMIAYLSGIMRTPMTAAFIVLEMTSAMDLLVPGLMVAFIADFASKQISATPLYEALAQRYLQDNFQSEGALTKALPPPK